MTVRYQEFTYEDIHEFFERMARESMDRAGHPAPSDVEISAFMVGAMCQVLSRLASGNAEDMNRFRERLK